MPHGKLEGVFLSSANPVYPKKPLKSRLSVVKWLKKNGYKASQTKVYRDIKNGLLKMELDGSILSESVRDYINHPDTGLLHHLELVSQYSDEDIKEYQRRSAVAKALKAELEAEKLQLELTKTKGKLIARENLELEMAGRAAIFEQGFRNFVRIQVDDWINIVGGDTSRAGELRTIINAQIDQLCNEYSRSDSFSVLFDDEL